MSKCDTLEAPTRDDEFRIYCETHDLYAHYECPYSRIAELEARIDTAIKYGNVECLVHAKNQDRAALREG